MSEPAITAPENAPEKAPEKPARKLFGRYPGLIALGLFLVAGLVIWQTGLLDTWIPSALGPEATSAPVDQRPPGININTASVQKIADGLGIKEKLAEEIVAKRPFKKVDDVKKVKGIGEKKLAKIRPLIRVD